MKTLLNIQYGNREVPIWDRIMSKREKIVKDYFKK